MSNYTPVEYLANIQKLKYKAAILPILLVILSFGLNLIFDLKQSKYLSIIGLVWYILIIVRFKITRNNPPESETEIMLSPIYGMVIKIENNSITIKKSFSQAADIRFSGQNYEVQIISKQVKYFEDNPTLAGKLIGVIPSSAVCICNISEDWNIEVNPGDKVVSGETILAVKL